MNALAGRLAVVTGWSRGIGRAVADVLVGAGATVVGLARTAPDGGQVQGMPCDVTDGSSVEHAAGQIMERHGAPSILVHSAGAFLFKAFAETTSAEFREQVEANLVGAFHVLRAFVPAMCERGGRVVTIGSITDHVPLPGNTAYGASKAGLRGLHDTVAAEYAGRGVTMTLISPGATDTTLWDAVDPDGRADLPDRSAMLRPEDVADAVLFAVTRPPRVRVNVMHLEAG
ncbi:MAG TPA: SDR family oxidoreductase [Gemmatimonadales bacterium]